MSGPWRILIVDDDQRMPIIMLTGKGDVIDRVAGLESGADDCLSKPFHLRELLARIRSVMRRSGAHEDPPEAMSPPAPSRCASSA